MKIYVSGSVGYGSTDKAARDDALSKLGINNLNVIKLSSVTPPGSEIVATSTEDFPLKSLAINNPDHPFWGAKLYAVYEELYLTKYGDAGAVGIGWLRFGDNLGGLIVEQTAQSSTTVAAEQQVKSQLERTARELLSHRNETEMDLDIQVHKGYYDGEVSCIFVLASFKIEKWDCSLVG